MIPVYLLSGTDGRVLTIDDSSVDQDLGADFTAVLTSVEFEAGEWSSLRRIIQTVHIGTSLTLQITPIVDESLDTSRTQPFVRDAATYGAVAQVDCRTATHGTRHQVMVAIPKHSGLTELGGWVRHLVPRRTERGD